MRRLSFRAAVAPPSFVRTLLRQVLILRYPCNLVLAEVYNASRCETAYNPALLATNLEIRSTHAVWSESGASLQRI